MRRTEKGQWAPLSYGGFMGQALCQDFALVMGGPCRIMVLSAVGVCRRMMASEALAS